MIAQRFRSVGWVAGVATAATLLYIISLQLATERGRLETIDRKIAATKRDIRQLQTEMGTRASLRQLERWNGEVLALSTPSANQFLPGEDAISAIDRGNLGLASAAPPPVMAAVLAPEPTKDAASTAETAQAETPGATAVGVKPALSAQDRLVQKALTVPNAQAVAVAGPEPRKGTSLEAVLKSVRPETSVEGKRKK